jgi:hypothetical protein
MEQYVITNPVPTPEEMADFLGVSRDRLAAIRAIMSAPTPARTHRAPAGMVERAAKRRKARTRKASPRAHTETP